MEIGSDRDRGILVLSLEGRLDMQGALDLEEWIREEVQGTDNAVVLDMSGISYLSSAGIRAIVRLEKMLEPRGGGLHIAGVQPYPLSVLELTGFSNLLSLHPTSDEAVLAARTVPGPMGRQGEAEATLFHAMGAEFRVISHETGPTVLEVTGEERQESRAGEEPLQVTVSTKTWSFGRGAPGSAGIPGDLITLGHVAVWLPEGGNTPDYLVVDRKRSSIPLDASFLVSPAEPGRYTVEVEPSGAEEVLLSDLLDALHEMVGGPDAGYRGALGFSFCAESPGIDVRGPKEGSTVLLAGCGVSVAPVVEGNPDPVAELVVRRNVPRVVALSFSELAFRKERSIPETLEEGLSSGTAALHHLSPRIRIRRATLEVSVISDISLHAGLEISIGGEIRGWNPEYEKIVRMVHPDCSEVRLHPISGGYSGSLVFQDEAYDRRGRREMPFVLKLDRWKNIKAEIEGYEGHVKRYIQNNATQIIQHERCGDYGGILYTFVGIQGAQGRIFSLEEYYLTHSIQEVLEVFELLFRKVLRAWYGQPQLRDIPLYQVYASIYNYEAVRQWAATRFAISPEDEYIDLPHGMGRSLNPLHFVEHVLPGRLEEKWSVYEGSVHGDLNLRNVLMDEGKNLWLIDFAMTGYSHILRDIAKLEAVLKMEMVPVPTEDRLFSLLELEKIFLSPRGLGEIPEVPEGTWDPEVMKAFQVVSRLRRYADSITLLDDDIRQYWLALLYYTLAVPAFVSVNDLMREYAWISSSLLCNALK